MTILTRTPTNPNPLQPNKFLLTFSRLPNMQYFCQNVDVPGISLSEIAIPNPFVELYSPGEKAIYDLFNVTFNVDEKLESWKEVHNWIRAMTFPKEYEEYVRLNRLNRNVGLSPSKQPQFSDATLTILSSSFNPTIRIKFYDIFPTSLSSFVLSAADSPENIITADATFRYTYYDVEVVS